VTFIPTASIDRRAVALWRRFGLRPAFDAEALLDGMDLSLLWQPLDEPEGTKVLGALKAANRTVLLNERRLDELEVSLGLRRFTIGHEIGHWVLHADGARSGTILLPLDGEGRVWCRSGSSQRVERQAEMFAARLLVPWDLISERVPTTGWAGWPFVYELAEAFAVTASAMVVRLEELNLAHRDVAGTPRSGRPIPVGQTTLFGA